ncbi:DUF2487 family protein [Paenibacillus aurantius]|uniref:DUF2487 family protein n=1 Tax=Paenibacillus aurantius TaxID=2918900 RepID=A0AA96RD10_9BACL|nr:DUF2487 family protein [Paenibacillus aurantius]WNQ09267.1 DUF2487 family protein [Paenibacillus aurantius]
MWSRAGSIGKGGGQVKFSEIREEQWKDLQPYLDTCLLPITGLTGTEPPWMTTEALEMLRDIMDLVENPYKGRLVTYPAMHYFSPPGEFASSVNHLCRKLKDSGFRYVFLITADSAVGIMQFADADLFLTPDYLDKSKTELDQAIRNAWNKGEDQM